MCRWCPAGAGDADGSVPRSTRYTSDTDSADTRTAAAADDVHADGQCCCCRGWAPSVVEATAVAAVDWPLKGHECKSRAVLLYCALA